MSEDHNPWECPCTPCKKRREEALEDLRKKRDEKKGK